MTIEAVDAQFSESTALAVREEHGGMMPLVSPDEARAQMRAYQELCAAILTADDYQEFTEKKKVDGRYVSTTKRFKKKSAVKKLQTYFGISVDVIDASTHRDDLGDGHFGFRCKAVATSPGGRSVAALAGCATHEDRFDVNRYDDESAERYAARQKKALARAYHDVLSTAETRATNRAVMNLVSPGEVTAEEISRPPRSAPSRPVADVPPPGPTLVELHAQAGAPEGTLGKFCIKHIDAGFGSRSPRVLSADETARVRDMLGFIIEEREAPAPAGPGAEVAAELRGVPAPEAPIVPQASVASKGLLFARLAEHGYKSQIQRHAFAKNAGVALPTDAEGNPTYAGISQAAVTRLLDELDTPAGEPAR